MNYVRDYYNNIELPDGPFGFSHVHESQITNILEKFDTNKAAGIDGLSGTFRKDGAKILSKLKPLFRKGSKLEPKYFRHISLLQTDFKGP